MPFAAQGSPDLIRKTSDLSVRRQCELLGVTRSKVYYTPKSPDEEAIERKERIMGLIDYWHTENPTWGARKIRVLLRNDGYFGPEVHARDGNLSGLPQAEHLEAQL